MGVETPVTDPIEDRLGQDRAGRIAGAEEENLEGIARHWTSPQQQACFDVGVSAMAAGAQQAAALGAPASPTPGVSSP